MLLKRFYRLGMNVPRRGTACTPCVIAAFPEVINQGFSHNGTAGITRTQHQHFERSRFSHHPQHPAVFSDGSQQLGVPIVSGVQQALSLMTGFFP